MSINLFARPYVIVETHYGSHLPAVFCGEYYSGLCEQALQDEADTVIEADRLASVLYDAPQSPELADVDFETLGNKSYYAFERIMDEFRPEEGYHLGFAPDDQALFAEPDGWDWDEEAVIDPDDPAPDAWIITV